MQHNRRIRAISNLARLQLAAKKLGNLNNDVVYLGGSIIALLINDSLQWTLGQLKMLIVLLMLSL